LKDDEVAEVRQALINMIREVGWEGFFEPTSTPFDIAGTTSDARDECLRLVEGLTALIEMLPELEKSIAGNEKDVESVVFELDPLIADDRVLSLPKIDRRMISIHANQSGVLRQTLQTLRADLETRN
jgi:hypothetical protein